MRPAFFTGIVFNVVNLMIIGFLVFRLTGGRWVNPYAAVALTMLIMRLLDTSGKSKVALSPRMSGGRGA